MPEVASAPANVTTTGWLYQPPTSRARSAAEPVTVGAVASYRSAKEAAAALPAASRHVPLTFVLALSGPEEVPEVHESIPEVASEPLKATSTPWLYQPSLSGPRDGVGVTDGGVPSYLKPSDWVAEVLPALSRQLPPTFAELESGPP